MGRSPAWLGVSWLVPGCHPSSLSIHGPPPGGADQPPLGPPGLAEPTLRSATGAGGAPRASPPPAQPGPADNALPRTPARQREPRRPFPSPRGAPAAEPSAQFRRPRAGTEPGRRAAAAGFRSSRRPQTLLLFAASKQLAGTLRAAPPSPRRGSAPPRARASRAPAPPPPTWSMSLSTAILPLLGAHTHTGPRSADVTPGAGEAEGTARGKEKNLAPEFDSPPPAPPPPPPPPPAERLTLASRVCSRARPPLYRKYRLLPAGPPLTSPRAASLAASTPGPTLPPAARGRASQPAAFGARPRAPPPPARRRGAGLLPASAPALCAGARGIGACGRPPLPPPRVCTVRGPSPGGLIVTPHPRPVSHKHNLTGKPCGHTPRGKKGCTHTQPTLTLEIGSHAFP